MRNIEQIRTEIDKKYSDNVDILMEDIENQILAAEFRGNDFIEIQLEQEYLRLHNQYYVPLITLEDEIIQGLFEANYNTECLIDHTRYRLRVTWK